MLSFFNIILGNYELKLLDFFTVWDCFSPKDYSALSDLNSLFDCFLAVYTNELP